ncbi:MAG: alpha/beta hydrolase [Actinomycetaceae bacterium]|nr:alpha/beta hydrolase [Actinomycetaceae bacterium]
MKPLVILIHGSMASSAQWLGYADLLPECDVVTIDLPAHGSRFDESWSLVAAVETIAEAVNKRAPGQKVILVGHSLGGYVATLYSVRNWRNLSGLILIGATGDPIHRLAGVYRIYGRIAQGAHPDKVSKTRLTVMRALGVREEQVPDVPKYKELPAIWNSIIASCSPGLLGGVNRPVLLINGEFDQMRFTEKAFLRAAPQAKLAIVPRSTHLAPLTHAEKVAWLIGRFTRAVAGN